MDARVANLLLAGFIVVTLTVPLMAGISINTPTQTPCSQSLAAGPAPRTGTIEAIVSEVDAWGGVTTIIGAMQNASHYENEHVQDIADIIVHQMDNDDGYVCRAAFSFNGLARYPNGVVGPPVAVLRLHVSPIIVAPADLDDAYLTDLSETEAKALAEEVANVYDGLLGTSLGLLSYTATETQYYFDPSFYTRYYYQFTYVDLLAADPGEAAVAEFRGVLAEMGGFMSLVGAPSWPDLLTSTSELIVVSHWKPEYSPPSFSVLNMICSSGPYIRAHSSHTELQEVKQNLVIAEACFTEPDVVQAVPGNEAYAVGEHLGYTSDIQNKMAEDPSCASISVVGGVAPGYLDIAGIPGDWMVFDDSYVINPSGPVYLPGYTLPANSTASDVFRAYLTYLPMETASTMWGFMEDIDQFRLNDYMDDIVDFLWGGMSPSYPDLTEHIYSLDFTTIETPVQEINIDLLAEIMAGGGMTPSALTSRINETILADDPVRAIVVAFFDYFDYYNLFDLLDNATYPRADALEEYLNTFQDGVGQFLHDFAGWDAPAEFQDKEAIAAFMEEHWDIALQALWTAMAANSTTDIKSALHAIFDIANAEEQLLPYMMADQGSPLLAGMDFLGAVNMDESLAVFGLTAEDFVLTFEADPDSLSIAGPHVIVTKTVADRTVYVGSAVEFEIKVENYGSATAYGIKILDGMSSGMDGEREFYWTHWSLSPGENLTISYNVTAAEQGLFSDFPTLCVYFNVSLASFDPADLGLWHGTARYTTSARGCRIQVSTGPPPITTTTTTTTTTTILGVPTLYVVAGVGGIGVLAVAILLVRRR